MARWTQYLRKNQKIVLVVVGVILMVAFTVGGSLDSIIGGGAGGGGAGGRAEKDPIVVTWAKGTVRESELSLMHRRHHRAVVFVRMIIEKTMERGGTPTINGQTLQRGQRVNYIGFLEDNSDAAIIQTMMLAEEARRMGVVVDQEAVKAYLRELSAPELGEADWLEIAKLVTSDGKELSVGELLDQLAIELRAQHVRVLTQAGLFAIPPAEMWDYFNRLNRNYSVEAYPIDVQPLVANVGGEPTSPELQAIYDEGFDRDPNPNESKPGFHQPLQVAFGYVKVDFKPFLEAAKKQVTEQQIEEQYKKDIEQGLHKVLELPGVGDKPAEQPAEGEKPTDKPAEGEPKEGEKPADKPADSDKPAEKPAEGVKPAEAAAEKPAEKPAEASPEEAPESECGEQEGDEQPAEAKPEEEKPAEVKPGETKPAEEKPAEKPAETTPTEAKPADPAKPAEPAVDPAKPVDPTKPAPAAEPAQEQKFKPLAEVREEILKRLAQPIAQDKLTAALKSLVDEIKAYGKSYNRWLASEGQKKRPQQPEPLDLEALAAKHGFTSGTTPLVDRFTVRDHEIGQKVSIFDFQGQQFRMYTFSDVAFGPNVLLYDPLQADSSEPDISYIFFRTEQKEPKDLTFAEAKDQIVAFWKRQKAYELARKEAEELAAKAQNVTSLKEVVPNPDKVLAPPAFSWMTTGSLAFGFGQPSLSPVAEVDLAGDEFMESVFALSPGQAGVAPNNAHSKVYVVRVVAQSPTDETLRDTFLNSGFSEQVLQVASRENSQLSSEWIDQLEARFGLKWHRPPNPGSRMDL